ncbi:MAG: PLDc N-terminal domain-containing protein [Propionibacteriaceae bacterium]|nr:PLDc N-terminal domain-containing protein [Propionibacteriaceae bacterium]
MGRFLPLLLLIVATIFTAVHVVQSNSERVRVIPKTLWFVLVLAVPALGMIGWWIFGRPVNTYSPPPTAPDDDPEFLRSI